jgi:methylthioribulose-1-phosphate dehydratase
MQACSIQCRGINPNEDTQPHAALRYNSPMLTLTTVARTKLPDCAQSIVDNAAELAAFGWTPATSSNFSLRLDEQLLAVTVSGKDKGKLTTADIMVANLQGEAVETDLRPSAETFLHSQLYARFPDIGCVLHTHSRTQTVASRLFAWQGYVRLAGMELLKAFRGHQTHDASIDLPILPNQQDMRLLATQIEAKLGAPNLYGYLIEGHGLYAWGRDMTEARRHLEAFEFLLACELDLRNLRA